LKYLDFSTLAQDANKIKAVQDISCLMDFPSTNEVGFMVKLLYKPLSFLDNSFSFSRRRVFLSKEGYRRDWNNLARNPKSRPKL